MESMGVKVIEKNILNWKDRHFQMKRAHQAPGTREENPPTSRLVAVKPQNAEDKGRTSSFQGLKIGHIEKNQNGFGFLNSNTVSEVNTAVSSYFWEGKKKLLLE